MSQELRYRRVVLKLSGETFCQPGQRGIDLPTLNQAAKDAIVKWVFTLVYVFPFSLTVLIPLSALFVLTAP